MKKQNVVAPQKTKRSCSARSSSAKKIKAHSGTLKVDGIKRRLEIPRPRACFVRSCTEIATLRLPDQYVCLLYEMGCNDNDKFPDNCPLREGLLVTARKEK